MVFSGCFRVILKGIELKKYDSFVLELVPLRGEKKNSSHVHKTGSWSLLSALFEMSDKLPRSYFGVLLGAGGVAT